MAFVFMSVIVVMHLLTNMVLGEDFVLGYLSSFDYKSQYPVVINMVLEEFQDHPVLAQHNFRYVINILY